VGFTIPPVVSSILDLLTDPIASALAVLVGCTTLIGGAAHYGSILAGKSKRDVEFMTGVGFFIGMVCGTGSLLFDAFY
jgi:hypothetical protein